MPQRGKRIETAGEDFNPKVPQRGKRIEAAGEVFNPKVPQGAKRIETAGKVFNPNRPQGAKRIETAGKVFNPNRPQRAKRIEMAGKIFNPKWFQKAEWIEPLVSVWKKYALAGAGACVFRDDGSLPALRRPPPARRKNRDDGSFWLQIFPSLCGFRLGGVFLAGAVACASQSDGSLPALRLHPPLAGKTELMALSGCQF